MTESTLARNPSEAIAPKAVSVDAVFAGYKSVSAMSAWRPTSTSSRSPPEAASGLGSSFPELGRCFGGSYRIRAGITEILGPPSLGSGGPQWPLVGRGLMTSAAGGLDQA